MLLFVAYMLLHHVAAATAANAAQLSIAIQVLTDAGRYCDFDFRPP
jgi:hypothetical protein